MPELPEVEIVRRGLVPRIAGSRVQRLIVRNGALRWPIDPQLPQAIAGARLGSLTRRGKYLVLESDSGRLVIHLGMSGSLRALRDAGPPGKHDHYDLVLDNGWMLRFNDPRRFGSLSWTPPGSDGHPLLDGLGCEPLTDEFDGDWLYRSTRGRQTAIKLFLMDGHQVVGIGNIYANEALFEAAINPLLPARRIGRERCARVVDAVKDTLQRALAAGGSTLRDFVDTAGACGSFQLEYKVYGRTGLPCMRCGGTVRTVRQGQRSTFYCTGCQR